jgi:hypothetical protein
MARLRPLFLTLWRNDAPLTAVGLLMLAVLGASLALVWLDPRQIGGVPAWLKPAKFAASTAIYSLTLAWMFGYLPGWTRTRRVVGWTTALVFVLEVALIDLQAARGTTSHFNVGTPFDVMLFNVMGTAIGIQTLASVAVAIALWRQRFENQALGWALRIGMTITLIGASTGGLMVQPTAGQLAEARATGAMLVSGAHTVGAPDGGPGLPGTAWSLEHGDLRVPHFLGLHAVQALPLLAMLVGRLRLPLAARARLVQMAGASYLLLFAILLWQAFRGQSIVAPDATTLTVLAAWLLATVAAGAAVTLTAPRVEVGRSMDAGAGVH